MITMYPYERYDEGLTRSLDRFEEKNGRKRMEERKNLRDGGEPAAGKRRTGGGEEDLQTDGGDDTLTRAATRVREGKGEPSGGRGVKTKR